MIALLMLLGGAQATTELAAAQRVAARLEQTDAVRIFYRHSVRWCPAELDALDERNWQTPAVLSDYDNAITVVRPAALNQFLTDDPQAGFVPVDESISDGRYTSRHVQPDATGYVQYNVAESLENGTFRWSPILQALDLQWMDNPTPYFNSASLLAQPGVHLSGQSAGVRTFSASMEAKEQGFRHAYELDLNERGSILRLKTTLYFNSGAPPATREMFVRSTQEVDGVEFPREVVFVLRNPTIGAHATIDRIELDLIEKDPSLAAADVRIPVERRRSRVAQTFATGEVVRRTYDVDGQLLTTDSWGVSMPTAAPPAGGAIRRGSALISAASLCAAGALLALRRAFRSRSS